MVKKLGGNYKRFVSVIIPTCNRPQMLYEALMSVSRQTLRNFETIVINDGGEDVSEVINEFKHIMDIYYYNLATSMGPSVARNFGIKKARGTYIAYLDDDDIYYPHHLATLIEVLQRTEYKVAYSDSYEAMQKWNGNRYITVRKKLVYSQDFDKDVLLIKNYIPTLTLVHMRDCIEEVGFFDENLKTHEDWDLWIRLSRRFKFIHVRDITGEFRTRLDQSNVTFLKQRDFLRTLRLIHSRYCHLATNQRVIHAQRKIQKCMEREIYLKEKIVVKPIKFSDRNDSAIEPKTSIIVPVISNSGGSKKLLSEFAVQRRVKNIEIIFIYPEGVEKLFDTPKVCTVKMVSLPLNKFKRGLIHTVGIAEATGDLILYNIPDSRPTSNYWLYKVTRPFVEYPDLVLLSLRKFIKPGANLFSRWIAESLERESDLDVIYSLAKNSKEFDLNLLDSGMKTKFSFINNGSFCIRRSVLDERNFEWFRKGDDTGFAVQLLENGMSIGYLASTGVYYYGELNAGEVLVHYYSHAKSRMADSVVSLSINKIGWNQLVTDIVCLYSGIKRTINLLEGNVDSNPIVSIRSFARIFEENINRFSDGAKSAVRSSVKNVDEESLDTLISLIDANSMENEDDRCNFRQNCLIGDFIRRVGQFGEYIYRKGFSLNGKEQDFISSIYKVFAMVVGEVLGVFFFEGEFEDMPLGLKRLEDYMID